MQKKDLTGFFRGVWRRLAPKRGAGDFRRRKRYRVSIENLSSLSTVAQVTGRRPGLLIGAALLSIVTGAAWLAVFVYTPLRDLLPELMQTRLRDDYKALDIRLDSLSRSQALTSAYLNNVAKVLGDSAAIPLNISDAEAMPLQLDSLIEASAAEKAWVQRFEDRERFNLSVLAPIAAAGMHFYAPAYGAVASEGVANGRVPQAVLEGPKGMGVSAVYRGTVIDTHHTDDGIVVVVQHPNDFITIYTGLNQAYVSRGDKVDAGARLGSAASGRPVALELWHNGTALNPLDYIAM